MVDYSLTDLKDMSGNSIQNTLTIPEYSQPTSCSAVWKTKNSSTSDSAFLETYKLGTIKDNLTTFKTALASANQTINISDTGIKTFLTTYLPTIKLVDECLRDIDPADLNKAQLEMDEAKTRLDAIRTPENHVSYYEGWFPIVRPMTEVALFGLFGTAIFMLLVSILTLLRMKGVRIELHIPEISIPFFTLPPNASYYMYGGLAFGIIGAYIYLKRTTNYV